ncbi:MAG: DUF4105 domain-containing protein [Elusimicrobiota bacterium]|nr:DUF4105 domain-containing protein [Elusimicrobiota bacterium]
MALPAGAAAPEEARRKAADARLWEDPVWLRLLHYKPVLGGALKGDATDGLYLSAVGRTDPKAELEASVDALFDPATDAAGETPACRLPARSAWLREKLGLGPGPACPRFEDWRRLLDARAVTLVFASSYVNNPSSMFGHTFLRLERASVGDDERLRDNTLNFAGETGEDNGALFAVKGLLGFYPGRYTAVPYFLKAAEYGHIESRDLWEYRLALAPEEVDRLAAHAWEVGRSTFPYYFLSKNCSYQLMPLLEAAAPRLDLFPGSPAIVGPVDTLRAVVETPGLVAETRYRPAHATVMRQRRALLAGPERRAAEAYAAGRPEEGDRLTEGLPSARRALVLDAAQDFVLYKKGFSPDVAPEVRALERSILLRRAKVPDLPVDLAPPSWAVPPETGHRRKRLMLGGGARRGGGFAELAWRPGYHDLLDQGAGFVPGAAIESMSWRLRYDGGERRVYARDLRLVEILSVAPFDPWTKKPSWTVGTGLDTAFEKGRPAPDALVYEGHAGSGLAFEPLPGLVVFGLTQAEGAAGAVLESGWRVGGSLRGGLTATLGRRWTALLDGGLSATAWGDATPNHRLRSGLNFAPLRDGAVRVEGLLRGPHREAGLYAVFYH